MRSLKKKKIPTTLIIGNFDGVHLGHRHLIDLARSVAQKSDGQVIAYTFSNHPSWILRPEKPRKLIIPLLTKLYLLKETGVDGIFLKSFSTPFSQKSALEFFFELKDEFDLDRLFLGHDACLGKEREGNRQILESYASQAGFSLQWVTPYLKEKTPVSSTEIRHLIEEGQIAELASRLGQPWHWDLSPKKGHGLGKALDFPTLNFDVSKLQLPPLGVWLVELHGENKQHSWGLANLGFCPTLKQEKEPLLEVYLFNPFESFSYRISFCHYLRPEKRFENAEALKAQIQKDEKAAQDWLRNKLT